MVAWRRLLANLVTAGFPEGTDAERLHRVGIINAFSVLAIVFMGYFGLSLVLAGRGTSGLVLLAGACAMAASIAYLRIRKDERGAAALATSVSFVVFFARVLGTPREQQGYFWGLAVPVFAVFALGLRIGATISAAFVLAVTAALYLPESPAAALADSVKIRLLSAFVAVSLLSFYVELARTRTERALRRSEHRFRALIENGASVYAVVGADGTVRYESPSLKRVYGYDPEELIGRNVMDLVHPDDRAAAAREFAALIENPGRVRTAETRYRHRDGSWREIEVSGVSLLHDAIVDGVVLTSFDITERKRAEREVRLLNETLEARVEQRSEELRRSEDRLRHSEKMQAIGQLAGGVAHDFNNHLAVIIGCLDMLKLQGPSAARREEYLTSASLAARRSAELAAQMLAFARHESPVSEAVDLRAVIRDVTQLLQHAIDKRIAIHERLHPGSHVVTGDGSRLHSALLNLAINARDAMPDGGELCFSSRRVQLDDAASRRLELPAGSYLEVSVADTGMGIDPVTQQRIFEPFFTTKPPGEGTGMGLAAVFGTLRSHHGAVSVESAPGEGSTFRVYLPVSDAVEAGAARPTPVPPVARPAVRVLLADDEQAVLNTLRLALEHFGHQVVSCDDGAAAVDLYRTRWREIDVVVLDMVMPKLNGRDAYMALRQINPAVKALLVSGYSLTQDVRDALDAGASGFIQKPFRITDFAQRIAELARA